MEERGDTKYQVREKEDLAIQWNLRKNRYYLLGFPIILKSDHMPLKHLFSRSDLKKRQVRWIEDLLEFDIVDFQHIAGKANVVADELWCNTGDSKTDKHTARQTNDRQEAGVEAAVIRSESQ